MAKRARKGSFPGFLVGLILAVALGVAVLSTLVWFLGTHAGLMTQWMLETAPPAGTKVPAELYGPLCRALCDYLRGGTSVFSFLADGISLFNSRELIHLADCAALFRFDHTVMIVSWIVAGVFLVLLLVTRAGHSGAVGLLLGTLLVVAGLVGLIIWGLADFSGLFLTFHRVAFSNDLWLLNPATDALIRLMPSGFFVRYGLAIGGGWLLLELVIFCFARWLSRLSKD